MAVAVEISSLFLIYLVEGGGGAFLVFYGAAKVIADRGVPYQLVHGAALNGAFPYLPWVGWVISPLTRFPYGLALALWLVLSGLAALAAAGLWARTLGWKRWWLAPLGVSVWCVLWRCLLTGQMDGVLLLIETLALIAAYRRHLGWAGALAVAAALYKPQMLWLLPPLLGLWAFQETKLRNYLTGCGLSLLALLGLPELAHPGITWSWLRLLPDFSSSLATVQPDLAGISGMFRFLPSGWGLHPGLSDAPTLLLVLVGLVGIGVVLRQASRTTGGQLGSRRRLGWQVLLPLGIWFVVSPYDHTNDALTLLPLIIFVLGVDAKGITRLDSLLLITLLWLAPGAVALLSQSAITSYLSISPLAFLALVIFAWGQFRGELTSRPAQPSGAPPLNGVQSALPERALRHSRIPMRPASRPNLTRPGRSSRRRAVPPPTS
ncbi:MAG: glycosyltransferase 87 family protein [Candidatus Dormibacteria bacterium]